MMWLKRVLGDPDVPVEWRRKSPDCPGQLGVYCRKGWKYVYLTDEDVKLIAVKLYFTEDKTIEIRGGIGPVVETVVVDRYALPFLKAVIWAVAHEIMSKETAPAAKAEMSQKAPQEADADA